MKRVLMGAGFAGMILLQINMAQAQYKGLGVESVSTETLKKYAPPSLDPIMANKLKKMFDVSSP